MPQFTATQLARLIKNVDRELLVEALEKADLTSILPNRHLAILDDLEKNWNVLFNVFLNSLTIDSADAVHRAQHDAYAFRRHPAGKPPAGRDALGQFQPTGVLFLDSMVASIQLATEIFNPSGFFSTILDLLEDLKVTPEEHITNITGLTQIPLHGLRARQGVFRVWALLSGYAPSDVSNLASQVMVWTSKETEQMDNHADEFFRLEVHGPTIDVWYPWHQPAPDMP